LQNFRERGFRRRQYAHPSHAHGRRIAAGEQRRTRGHAYRTLTEGVLEDYAGFGQSIQMGRLDDRMSHEPKTIGPMLIRHNPENVHLGLFHRLVERSPSRAVVRRTVPGVFRYL
jgi:hypothetical protein